MESLGCFKAILKGATVACQPAHSELLQLSQAGLEVGGRHPYPDPMTDALTEAIEARFEDIEATEDPVERFRMGRELRAKCADAEQRVIRIEQVIAAELKEGRTWLDVGKLLGVTGSRAEQIAKGR